MTFDYYAHLDAEEDYGGSLSGSGGLGGLVAGFVDECTTWFTRGDAKDEARNHYIKRVKQSSTFELPDALALDPDPDRFPDDSWVHIEVRFGLTTPWYSKDDRLLHVLDNPIRKDKVFGVPYMSAANWKGLLRWSCRMQGGLRQHLEQHKMRLDGWRDPRWILHLFGNDKGEAEAFQCGALVFYPTWFSRVAFEVINPHSRAKRAGKHPIHYEVVPAGAEGRLRLLYAPLAGAMDRDEVKRSEVVERLLDATDALLTTYGISAKRTVGWGTGSVETWVARRNGEHPIQETSLAAFKARIVRWLQAQETLHE